MKTRIIAGNPGIIYFFLPIISYVGTKCLGERSKELCTRKDLILPVNPPVHSGEYFCVLGTILDRRDGRHC